MTRPVSVIVVDDSAFMRKSLSMMLESDPQIKVIATARDGREGVDKIRELRPDLVTMDIEMPVMDGLTALGIIMKEMPLPVLMVSSLTTDGAKATLDALALGAVDFIPKELSYVSLDIAKIKEELISKVRQIVASTSLSYRLKRIRERTAHESAAHPSPRIHATKKGAVPRRDLRAAVIAVSTGGPLALMKLIPNLPANFPVGIAVVQHMPPKFTQSMAERLNAMSQLSVREAQEGDRLETGNILIAPGGHHLTFNVNGNGVTAHIGLNPSTTLYRPCADIMINSVVEAISGPILGVVMTGMGKDGLEGARAIKRMGGLVVAQDEESCIVYGMPKAVVDDGLADYVSSLEDLPTLLQEITQG